MKLATGNMLHSVKQGIILQQVNAQGVMGSGIAKEIRSRWPAVWESYSKEITHPQNYTTSLVHLGRMIPVEVEPGLWVLNLVGQQFYGKGSTFNGEPIRYTSYDALDDALVSAAIWMSKTEFTSADVHHPLIGCGLGGGSWPVVGAMISDKLGDDSTLWMLE